MPRIALRQPLLSGLAAGKWDRFATYGRKIQEGQEFEFTTFTLGQIVDNFARLFSGRRLGMDYEHQAMNAPKNGQPAPQLAYYNALAVIEDGAVVKFYAQKPDVAQPDPALLLAQLRQRFPEGETVDGLWGYRCEHTPLGAELLPNYEQISPLFTSEGTDEQERPVGYHLMNVSAVAVAFQDGTVFNLKHGLGYGDSSLHTPEPTKGAKMADEKKKDEGEDKPNVLRGECMKKFGLPEDSEDAALYGAVMATKFGDLEIKHVEDEDEKEAKDLDKDGMGKMGDLPDEMPAAMSKALFSRLNEEAKRREAAEARLAAIEAREQVKRTDEYRALSKHYVSDTDAMDILAQFSGDIDRAAAMVRRFPRITSLSARMTAGGAPIGSEPDQSTGSTIEDVNGVRVIGRGLSAMSKKLLDEGKAKTLGEAMILAAKAAPHLYTIR